MVGSYGPDVFADSLISFANRHRDQPFFAYFPMALTHDPFQPSPDHPDYDAFDPATMRMNDPALFGDNVAYMDKVVGRIVNAIDDIGIRDNTLIFFIGDNGTDRDVVSPYGEGEIRGNKGYPTRYGTHVPMIANWPGKIEAGRVNDNLIDFTDFVPTLIDFAGTELPSSGIFDGLSFRDQLLGEADSVRSYVFCHYAPQWGKFEHVRYVHNKDWKLYGDGRIYNVKSDPMELNVVGREELTESAEMTMQSFEKVLARLQ
jgi:arylsulfatase A-like enzyme